MRTIRIRKWEIKISSTGRGYIAIPDFSAMSQPGILLGGGKYTTENGLCPLPRYVRDRLEKLSKALPE